MLELRNISKSFAGERILRSIDLTIAEGEIVALLGPSGSGKTTLLRIIAGLEQADGGQLLLRGEDLTEIAVHRRGFGMVFQDYALFPHKSVAENVSFGLRMLGWDAARIGRRVERMLALVGLAGFGERPVYELSGGEQQRVALARALAPSPRLLLLDEPLGALDRALRERLMGELRTILKAAGEVSDRPQGITAIYVTHDQAEAFAVADRVVVMSAGCIEQVDAPVALYRHPATPFVARFIGMENLFPAEVVAVEARATLAGAATAAAGLLPVSTPFGTLQIAAPLGPAALLQEPILLIRPEAGRLLAEGEEATNVVEGRLADCSFRGRYQEATVALGEGNRLELEFEADEVLPPVGSPIRLALEPAALTLLRGTS